MNLGSTGGAPAPLAKGDVDPGDEAKAFLSKNI